jgi:hypothetical protein
MKKLFFVTLLFVSGCASFTNISKAPSLDKKGKIVVLPLINNSETPMSGFKAKNMAENELYSKGFSISPLKNFSEDENFSEKEVKEALAQFKGEEISYALYGYVNEWRYKSGADYEPAVSLTFNLYDLKNEKVIWSSGGSNSMSSYKSCGIAAQKLIKKLLSPLK